MMPTSVPNSTLPQQHSSHSTPLDLNDRSSGGWYVDCFVLLTLAAVLIASNPFFSILDDEANAIVVATMPAARLVTGFLTNDYAHAHPPLPDIVLHEWLRLTGSRFWLLRIPGILLYVGGLALVLASADRLGGRPARRLALWLGVFWPYGFHFGRLAGWFEFAFFSVALLTYTFLRAIEQPHWRRWAWFGIAALFAVYVNLYAWAVLALFAVELAARKTKEWKRFAVIVALLAIAYLPVWSFLWVKTEAGISAVHSLLALLLLIAYHLYAVFVSESVAPWFLALSIPALISMALVAMLVTRSNSAFARRLLLYFFVLLLGMSASGVITTKRLLMVTPWLLLGLAVSVTTWPRPRRTAVTVALAVVGLIGWVGICSRNMYAAPHFVEPWSDVARASTEAWNSGATVLSNNSSFLFYSAYDVGRPWSTQNWSLPKSIYNPEIPRLYHVQLWRDAGAPLTSRVLLVTGVDPFHSDQTAWAQQRLDSACRLQAHSERLHDSGFGLKKKFFPQAGQVQWRIEIRDYVCAE